MRALFSLVALLAVCTCSCSSPYLVVSNEGAIESPFCEGFGLAGSWTLESDPVVDDPNAREKIVFAGPDQKGTYVLELSSFGADRDALVGNLTVEKIAEEPDRYLLEFVIDSCLTTDPKKYFAYCAVEGKQLKVWQISSAKLQGHLERSDSQLEVDYNWPFVTVFENDGELQEILHQNAKDLVEPPLIFMLD